MEKKAMNISFAICMVCSIFYTVNAFDSPPLQDFCVGVQDPKAAVFVNGLLCKNPKKVTVKDFVFQGFDIIGDTNNTLKVNASLINIEKFPALNTQGLSISHIDFGPFGLNTPHHHPRASEVFTVIYGTLYAGFVTTEYELFSVVLKQGDVFIFPQGLIHFQFNIKNAPARAIAAFSSQNPGRLNNAEGVLGTTPRILDEVLALEYQVDEDVVQELRAQFSSAFSINEIEGFTKSMRRDA